MAASAPTVCRGTENSIALVSFLYQTEFHATTRNIWRWVDRGFSWVTRLNYGRENIFEGYYTLRVWSGIFPSLGLQHISNPGYNRDRGPVLVPTLLLHLEL